MGLSSKFKKIAQAKANTSVVVNNAKTNPLVGTGSTLNGTSKQFTAKLGLDLKESDLYIG